MHCWNSVKKKFVLLQHQKLRCCNTKLRWCNTKLCCLNTVSSKWFSFFWVKNRVLKQSNFFYCLLWNYHKFPTFDVVVHRLDCALPYDLIPYWENNHTHYYDDLVYQFLLKVPSIARWIIRFLILETKKSTLDDTAFDFSQQKFDAVVGDTTIFASRRKHVDFTQPFTESGVIWLFEHRVNPIPSSKEDRGNMWWLYSGIFSLNIHLFSMHLCPCCLKSPTADLSSFSCALMYQVFFSRRRFSHTVSNSPSTWNGLFSLLVRKWKTGMSPFTWALWTSSS